MSQQINDKETISRELCSFISANLLADEVEITPDTVLAEIGIDSYSIIEIVLFIERNFSVAIPDSQLTPENLKSVNSIAACTCRLLNENRE